MKHFCTFMPLLFAAVALPWWHYASTQPDEENQVVKADWRDVVKGNNTFALNLYAELSRREKDNLFFCPISISTALAMTSAGARGETEAEMARVLHFPPESEQRDPAFKDLIEQILRGGDRYKLHLANRLWGQEDYDFHASFLRTAQTSYQGGLGRVDFQGKTAAARQEINEWVERQTSGKVKNMLPAGALDSDTRLVLTNAVYFKAPWNKPFDEDLTEEASFRLTSRTTVAVPLMSQSEEHRYVNLKTFAALEMDYAGEETSLMVLLPAAETGLAELEKQLSPESVEAWRAQMRRREVLVYLPRFQMQSHRDLTDDLRALGLGLPFSDAADFSGMSDCQDLFLAQVLHQAAIEVTERGTEASAGTAASKGMRSLPPTFRADRPFLFLILHKRTGSILFLGRMMNPVK